MKAEIKLTEPGKKGAFGTTYKTNELTGRYVMVVRPGHDYHMTVSSDGFVTWEYDFHAEDNEVMGEMALDVLLVHNERTAGTTPQP